MTWDILMALGIKWSFGRGFDCDLGLLHLAYFITVVGNEKFIKADQLNGPFLIHLLSPLSVLQ